MTSSSQFDELELDRYRFELRHKGDNSRLVGKQEVICVADWYGNRLSWR
ncbi:MAG: hypothetical protein WCA16_02290 [Candidatus Sulfotelmatobacter sp.]